MQSNQDYQIARGKCHVGVVNLATQLPYKKKIKHIFFLTTVALVLALSGIPIEEFLFSINKECGFDLKLVLNWYQFMTGQHQSIHKL